MAAFSSPLRLLPPLTPRRVPSPTMSPGTRRGRPHGYSEESRLRDLSPGTTLRAFAQKPMPFDTTSDEYKMFACIESLTPAERDLGARVARAAQRLQSWCAEIRQWGWSGSFEQPSAEYQKRRRRSLELRIMEHVAEPDLTDDLPPLEYWGSLLSVEVQSHEARLDDIEEELLKLDVEELKEHVLDMHPAGGSRPPSAGYDARRQQYRLMDDFSFLITQTLLSALPHHAQLKERLSTWTARVSVLREAPRFLEDLKMVEKAVQLSWDAMQPPHDPSDAAFGQWNLTIETITSVLRSRVGDLGRRLDKMLDTLEGREDCLPDAWIDKFELTEADFGRWAHESRRAIIEANVRRKPELKRHGEEAEDSNAVVQHSSHPPKLSQTPSSANVLSILNRDTQANDTFSGTALDGNAHPNNPIKSETKTYTRLVTEQQSPLPGSQHASPRASNIFARSTPQQLNQYSVQPQAVSSGVNAKLPMSEVGMEKVSKAVGSVPINASNNNSNAHYDQAHNAHQGDASTEDDNLVFGAVSASLELRSRRPDGDAQTETDGFLTNANHESSSQLDDEFEYEDGDTIIHNDIEESMHALVEGPTNEDLDALSPSFVVAGSSSHEGDALDALPVIFTTKSEGIPALEPPHTPRSRRGSIDSLSSTDSFDSSPLSVVEESPSVRNTTNRPIRAPRPELNAAMSKRRPMKVVDDSATANPPWPPTQFSQPQSSGVDDLERKISDILTTIPAHIRLTSGPGADAPEVKPTRGIAKKTSRGFLRAARSASGIKSPELTLSPAKADYETASTATGRKSAASRADNDIKLYHLTQPGKEQPVKLFIRRVGENGERVMVRVGGGWADLGEYLRQYAEHHGRRTVSDGKFEILGLEVKNPDNSPSRPESSAGKRDRHFSGRHTPNTTPSKPSGLSSAMEEVPPPMPPLTSTPGKPDEVVMLPSPSSSQRSWQGDEVGLAGPKVKKLDLSGEKLEWIEGMMKQARTVSGNLIPTTHTPLSREDRSDSRSDSRSGSRAGQRKADFGDLGKVGGTKRIFLRGGQPTLGDH